MKLRIIAGCLVAAGAIGAFIIQSVAKEKALEEETSAFVTDTVSAISDPWNAQALVSRAEPGLIKAMTVQGQSIADLFAVYGKLGSLKSDPDCRLKDTSQFYTATETYTTASYNCGAEYDKGTATLLITIRKEKSASEWKVYYLNISSSYFTEAGYKRTK